MRTSEPGPERTGPRWSQARLLRAATIGLVTLVLLGALPGFLLIRDAARDPVFRELGALPLPGWAARDPVDQAEGSRWCLRTCRRRERVWRSERDPAPTAAAYATALTRTGWQPWPVAGCPATPVPGVYTCWRRDEYVLDLWVQPPDCQPTPASPCPPSLVSAVVRNRAVDPRGR